MKKGLRLTAGLLTLAMLCSCGNAQTSDTLPSDTGTAENVTEEQQAPLSNPVVMTAEGDVDMEVALAYQTDFDKLLADLDAKTVPEGDPVSDNTNPKTKAVFDWLRENYGKNIIAAQQMENIKASEDILYYYLTEDLPAIKGFDFIFTTTPDGDGSDWTQMAIDWHTKSGGLVTFTWHWNVPADIDNPDNGHAFYSKYITNFSLENAVTPGTKEYEVAVHDIDLIAHELQRLEAAGVPVLWRPLHEGSGDWFWWGVNTKEAAEKQLYQKLWYMIYDRLENYHKLTNLIWVWNGQNRHTQVHPNTYDISGMDIYPNSPDHSAQQSQYNNLIKLTAEGKMTAISECGYIPDSDEIAALSDEVKWLYFMPWNSDFIYSSTTVLGIPRINEEKMDEEFFKKVMTAENVITWSELPDFEGTERNLPERLQLMLNDINSQREKDAKK